MRIDVALDVAPARPGLNANPFLFAGEIDDSVEPAEVEVQAAWARGLASHAEPSAADRDRPSRRAQYLTQSLDGGRALHFGDDDRMELGDFVDDDSAPISSRLPLIILQIILGHASRRSVGVGDGLAASGQELPPEPEEPEHWDEDGE